MSKQLELEINVSDNQNESSNDEKESPSSKQMLSLNKKRNKKSIHFKNVEVNNDVHKSHHSSQNVFGVSMNKSALEIDSEGNLTASQVQLNSPQNSLRSITLKNNPSSYKDDQKKGTQTMMQRDGQCDSNANTPLNKLIQNNPNLQRLHREQFLKKQNHWSEEIDVKKYKPHQIHSKIDNINPFDQNLENQEAIEILKCILSKHPGKRNSKEILFVRKCLKNVKFFTDIENNLPEELILRLCKFLNYERYPQFHRLYKAGDFGRKFYIILDGAVFIMTHSITKTFDTNVADNKEEKQIKQMIMHEFEDSPKFFPAPLNFEDIVDESQFIEQVVSAQNEGFNIKKTLEVGDGFGEIALRTEGIRTASVVCKEDSHFVSITSSTYQEVLDSYHDLLYKEKIDFLKNVSIFKKWSLAFIHEIMMQVNIKQYKRGDILYEEGEKSKNLYFVRSGEVELQQVVEVKDEKQSLKSIPDKLVKSNLIWNEKMKNSKLKKCSLVILGPYQYFGDYEIFKKSKRITKAVCYSNTELFILDKKEFFENMQFINMVKEIHNLFKEREIWYKNMIAKNLSTDAQIYKNIARQKQLQSSPQNETNTYDDEKSRRQSNRQDVSTQNTSSLSQLQNDKGKYSRASIELSQKSIAEDLNQYSQSSFLDKINIYKDMKSPKGSEQELFLDQIRIRNKNQLKKRWKEDQEEAAIDNVIKLKQFVGKSMNLMQQIESAKTIAIPKAQVFRKSEEIAMPSIHQDQKIPSVYQLDDNINYTSPRSDLKQNPFFHSNQQNLQLIINHSPSKSSQNIPSIKELTSPKIQTNSSFQSNQLFQHKSIADSQTHSNITSPKTILSNKSTFGFKKQPQSDNNTPIGNNNNNNNNNNNQPTQLYQLKVKNNHAISSQSDQMKRNSYQNFQKGSLEDIEYLAQELERNVKSTKNQTYEDDNLTFIKSQIDANKKSLLKLKMEQNFTHKYLCEKTGRYKIPSTQQLNEQEREQYNGITSHSMKDITDRTHPSQINNQNKQNISISLIYSSETLKGSKLADNLNNSTENANHQNGLPRLKNENISLPQILVSPKLMNKEINFSKNYKKGMKQREYFQESQAKRILKLC